VEGRRKVGEWLAKCRDGVMMPPAESPDGPVVERFTLRGSSDIPPFTQEELVAWCFQKTREQIETRLLLLDRSSFGAEHRNAVCIQREGLPREDSSVSQLLRLYDHLCFKKLPHNSVLPTLDSWASREGGCARTSELLTAVEILNFYRWLCCVPRLQVDTFRQELADMVLQVLTRRDSPANMEPGDDERFARFGDSFADFMKGDGPSALVVTHLPTAAAAMRHLFIGLPTTGGVGGGSAVPRIDPRAPQGADIPKLPELAEQSLWAFMPLLRLAPEAGIRVGDGEGAPCVGEHLSPMQGVACPGFPEAPKVPHSIVVSRAAVSGPSPRLGQVPVAGIATSELGLANCGFGASRSKARCRRTRAWGDMHGVVAFRRCALDPRLRSTGLIRRGCKTCFWTAPHIDGEPCEASSPALASVSFLDPELIDKPVVVKHVSEPMVMLHRWRDEMTRRLTLDVEKCHSAVYGADAFGTETGAPHTPEPISHQAESQAPAIERQTTTMQERSRESCHSLTLGCMDVDSGEVSVPLFVCFPPPGIVPIEVIDPNAVIWTISPDPQRLAPTAACRVQVFRVLIDVERGCAERESLTEEPLNDFCVDCGDMGTSFCVFFSLVTPIQPADQFEVVLSGLAGSPPQTEAIHEFKYFVSFESFQPSVRDLMPLRRRAADFLALISADYVWHNATWFCPESEGDEHHFGPDAHRASIRIPDLMHHSPATTFRNAIASGGILRNPARLKGTSPKARPTLGSLRSVRPSVTTTATKAKKPPPFGLVSHPMGSGSPTAPGGYVVNVSSGNEVVLAVVVPLGIVVKPSLALFVKSSAKWETLPHGIFMMYFDTAKGGTWQLLNAIQPADQRFMRVVIRALLPMPGRYEIRLQWGLVPVDPAQAPQSRGASVAPAPHDHPLLICLRTPAKTKKVQTLVPYIFHSSAKSFGYPWKHPLAEHYGVMLLGPMRYRLRIGFVRFTVHVRQGGVSSPKDCAWSPDDSQTAVCAGRGQEISVRATCSSPQRSSKVHFRDSEDGAVPSHPSDAGQAKPLPEQDPAEILGFEGVDSALAAAGMRY